VATLFDVSVASVVKWSQRQRATGSAAARPMGGHRKRLLEPHRTLVIDRLKAVPDLTLKALVAELAEHGIATCPVSVWRFVRSEGMSFKKSLFAEEQARPAIARRRAQWKKYQGRLDPRRLVFIDETWAKTNMTPIRGWAPRGRKLVAHAPFGKWKTLTGTVSNFVRGAGYRHQMTNLSPKITANWVFASLHSRGGRFHSSAALLRTRYSNFIAASSPGK